MSKLLILMQACNYVFLGAMLAKQSFDNPVFYIVLIACVMALIQTLIEAK